MKLISDINEEVSFVLKEEASGKRSYMIEGPFLQAELKNKNNRVYPLDVLSVKVSDYTRDYIKQNRAFGELGHPDSPRINLDRVSHMITDLRQEGNNFIGRAKILDTPYGKIVQNLMDAGAKLGVSSRAVGSLSEVNGCHYVNDDLLIATAADIVADPSAPDAFVRGIMESAEWVFVDGKGWVCEYVETARKNIVKAPSRKLEKVIIEEFEKFVKLLTES